MMNQKISNDEKNDELKELENKLEIIENKINEYSQLVESQDDVKLEDSQYERYLELKDECQLEIASINNKYRDLNTKYEMMKNKYENIENEISTLNERKLDINNQILKYENELNEMNKEKNELSNELKENKNELNEYNNKFGKLENDRIVINKKLEKLSYEMNEMNIKINETKQEKENKEILSSLQKLFTGIYGKLCDLIEPTQKKYNIAVAVALGINHNSIVVEDKNIAIACMQHMKDTKRGHMQFIPLNDVRGEPITPELRRLGGTSQALIEGIKYDRHLENAILYAFSNTIVVDTLQEARYLAYSSEKTKNLRIRIITLDGTLIAPNGNMTGGYSDDFRKKAQIFTEKEYKKKENKRNKLIDQLKNIDREFDGEKTKNEINDNILNINNSLNDLNKKINVINNELNDKKNILKNIDNDIKNKQPIIKSAKKEVNDAKSNMEKCKKDIDTKQDKIFEEFTNELGISNIREYEENELNRIEKRLKEKQEMKYELEEIKNKIEYNKSNNINKEINDLNNKLKEINKDIKNCEKEIKNEKKKYENEVRKLDELEEKEEEFDKNIAESQKNIKLLRTEVNQLRDVINKKMKEKNDLDAWTEKLLQQQINIKQQANSDGISLTKPKKRKNVKKKKKKSVHRRKRRKKNNNSSSDENESEDNLDESSEEQQSDINEDDNNDNDDDEDDDMNSSQFNYNKIDFEQFKNDPTDLNLQEYEKKKKDYQFRINELTNIIENLSPNLKSLKQYKNIVNKTKDSNNESKIFRKKLKKKLTEFQDITEKRNDVFLKTFNIVAKNIKSIYKNLTKSNKNKNGGYAYLNIGGGTESFNNDILYSVMPPGKPYRDMNQLSGGEKSIASLALLFAIHSCKPVPFFILDEIDANLDTMNVAKLSNFIKEKCSQNKLQTIVISLKDKFYSKSDALVGVCKDRKTDSSKALTLDLTKFDD